MVSKLSFIKNKNFVYTLIAKSSDILIKLLILVILLKKYDNVDFVKYTYFLSFGAILGYTCEWGGSRVVIRNFISSNSVNFNVLSVIILFILSIFIYFTNIIKFYNLEFLIIVSLYSLGVCYNNILYKYFEYIEKNEISYKYKFLVNTISLLFVIVILLLDYNVNYTLYVIAFFEIILFSLLYYNINVKVYCNFDFMLLKNGFPFYLNTVSTLAFSQFNIMIVNQFFTDKIISNFVLAQRFTDLSLLISDSFTSSHIGKYFKKEILIKKIRKRVKIIWLTSAIILFLPAILVRYGFEGYDIFLLYYCFMLPQGISRTLSATYSLIIDYTKYYMLRTYAIIIILIANIAISTFLFSTTTSKSILLFILIIDFLLLILLYTYNKTFKIYKIDKYEFNNN